MISIHYKLLEEKLTLHPFTLGCQVQVNLGILFFTTCESPYGHIGLTWYF